MTLKKGSEVNLTIEKLAFGGEGIGYVGDSFVVFVTDTIPGDVVKARITKKKNRFAYAEIEELIIKSPNRIEARCKHFNTCGGCKLQYLPYKNQLKNKEQQVTESFVHLAKIPDPPVQPIIGCENPWFYRNKMEFSFGFENNGIMLGLHPAKKRYEVFDLDECYLLEPYISNFINEIREFAKNHNLTVYHPKTNEGLLKSVYFRTGKKTGELMINLVINVPYETDENSISDYFFIEEFTKIITKSIKPTSIYLTLFSSQKGKKTKEIPIKIFGNSTITEKMKINSDREFEFNISPFSFFQPNTKQAETLYNEAIKLIGRDKKKIIFDLYCGTGTIGLSCSEYAEKIIGIDIQESSIENAKINAKNNRIKNVEFHQGDVLQKMNEILSDFPETCLQDSCVILDPPRAGLAQKFTLKLISLELPQIIYISCNPATLARDIKEFTQHGYKLKTVQPIDMLPHTYHIECIALLRK